MCQMPTAIHMQISAMGTTLVLAVDWGPPAARENALISLVGKRRGGVDRDLLLLSGASQSQAPAS